MHDALETSLLSPIALENQCNQSAEQYLQNLVKIDFVNNCSADNHNCLAITD